MPKNVFDELNRRVAEDKAAVQASIDSILSEVPTREAIEEKRGRFSAALSALDDSDITAEAKNRMLKSCIEKISYYREPPVRKAGAPNRGWIVGDISVDANLCI